MVLLVVLAGGYTYLKIQSSAIARNLLTQLFNKNDTRTLDIPNLDLTFSLWNQSIEVSDVKITTTDSLAPTMGLDIHIDKFRFKLKSVLDLILNERLELKSMEIIHPEVILRHAKRTQSKRFSFEAGSLYNEIQQYVRTLQIDDFQLSSGSVTYESKDQAFMPISLADFSLKISQFLMDSASVKRKDQVFFTESIIVDLKDQEFQMPDSIHTITFDRFHISTRDKVIFFENVTMRPEYDKNALPDAIERYDISVPRITLRGMDFVKAYNDDQIAIEYMALEKPSIQHEGSSIVKERQKKNKRKSSNRIMKTFTKIFHVIAIDTFRINHAGLDVTSEAEEVIRMNDISLGLFGFKVDSGAYQFGEEVGYFQDLLIEINNYDTQLDGDRFEVGFGKLLVNTKESEVELSSAYLKSNEEGQEGLNFYLPFFRSTGSNYREAVTTGILEMGSIELVSPQVEWNTTAQKGDQRSDSTMTIGDYLKEVHITSLDLREGDYIIRRDSTLIVAEGLDVSLADVVLYSRKQNLNVLQTVLSQVSLAVDDLHVQTGQTLDVSSLVYDGRSGNLSLEKAAFVQDSTSEIYLDSVVLIGWGRSVSPDKEGVHFDSLIIGEAKVNVHARKSKSEGDPLEVLKRSAFDYLDVGNTDLDYFIDDQRKYTIQNIDLLIRDFYYDSIADDFPAMASIGIDSISLDLDSMAHHLRATEIYLSNEDSIIHFGNVSMSPYESTQPNRVIFEGKELEFDGLDVYGLANEQRAFFRNGYIKDPKIKVSWNLKERDQSPGGDSLDFREYLRFDQFLIDEADIDLTLISETDSFKVKSDFLTIGFEKYNQFQTPGEHLFYTRNITLDLHETSVSSTLLEEELHLDSLIIKTEDKEFLLAGLRLQKKGKFDVKLDQLVIDELDYKALRRGNGLQAKELLLRNPAVFYDAVYSDTTTSSKESTGLFTSRFPGISIERLNIENGYFDIAQNQIVLGDTLHLRDFGLGIGPIKLDSTTTPQNYDMSGLSIDLNAGDMYLEFSDSLSFIQWDALSFEDDSKTLTLLNPGYGHKHTKEQFTDQIEFQKTWVRSRADSVILEGIALEELVRSNAFKMAFLRVHGLNLHADRDNRITFDPNQYKELPSLALMEIKNDILIDSIHVYDANVAYTQQPDNNNEKGILEINDINAGIGNITNMRSRIQSDPKMRFSANGKLAGSGDFTMDVAFDLDKELGTYTMNGRVGSMDLTDLNDFMEPVVLVQIQSGDSKYIEYDFVADTVKAVGKLRFYYKDLRINVLKRNEARDKYKNRSFLTFFANAFVVHHKNPKFLTSKRKDIFYERDPQRGILDYWTKSILSGVAGSVGALNTKKKLKQFNAQSESQEQLGSNN